MQDVKETLSLRLKSSAGKFYGGIKMKVISRLPIIILSIVFLCLFVAGKSQASELSKKIFIIGDSTVQQYAASYAPLTAWGMMLEKFTVDGVTIYNEAQGGQSSKSYIDLGYWDSRVFSRLGAGDIVFIQWGHNDEIETNPMFYTDPNTTFKTYLNEYVTQIRSKNAIPIFVTPMVNNYFRGDGIQNTPRIEYVNAMIAVGSQTNTPVINMNAISMQKFLPMGEQGAEDYFLVVEPGIYERYPNGFYDRAHFQVRGAYNIAKWLVEDINRQNLSIKSLFNWSGTGSVNHSINLVNASSSHSSLASGKVCDLVADTPAPGQKFLRWKSSNGGEFVNVNMSATSFFMPNNSTTITAEYGPTSATYSLTVVNGGGSGTYAANFVREVIAYNPPAGYHFVNWTSSNGGIFTNATSPGTSFAMPANDTTITANYAIDGSTPPPTSTTYTLNVVNGNGDGSYASGNACQITANAAPTGQHFVNWTSSNGGTFANASSTSTTFTMPANAVNVTANYANDSANPTGTYTLTVNGGTGDGTYAASQTREVVAYNPPAGQHFVNWTSSNGGTFHNANSSGTVFTMPANDTTVTANYASDNPTTPTTYALNVVNGSGDGSYTAGNVCQIIANAAPAGQHFVNWTSSNGGIFASASSTSTTFTMPANAVTVTANYANDTSTEPTTYALNVVDGSGDGSYTAGNVCQITANAAPTGQHFVNWTSSNGGTFANASSTNTTFTMPGNAVTITANYANDVSNPTGTYTLTVNGGTGDGPYAAGQTREVVAYNPPAGQHFVNWTSSNGGTFHNASSSGTVFTMPANDTTVTANYASDNPTTPTTYALNVVNGSGDGSYTAGNVCQVTANAAPAGQHFVNWTSSNGGTFASASSTSTTFTMPANAVTVTANYANDAVVSSSSIQEDAEDGNTANWDVYDATPEGATIANVVDPDNAVNRVIKLTGDRYNNGYRYDFENPEIEKFNIQWKMKYSESFTVYIACETTEGFKFLYYSHDEDDLLGDGGYVHHGLGAATKNGNWITITRDLQQDLHDAQPECDVIEINAFYIRGSGYVDDIVTIGTGIVQNDLYNVTFNEGANGIRTGGGDLFQIVIHGQAATSPVITANPGWIFTGWDISFAYVTKDITANALYIEEAQNSILLEDAEDGDTANWDVYDATPEGATITNVVDPDNAVNRVIKLTGDRYNNGYRYDFENPEIEKFNIQWKMKYSESFTVYIACETTEGFKFLYYSHDEDDLLGDEGYVHHGLGTATKNGSWVTITRDLQQDLHDAQPECDIIEINAFYIRGSGYVDDISVLENE